MVSQTVSEFFVSEDTTSHIIPMPAIGTDKYKKCNMEDGWNMENTQNETRKPVSFNSWAPLKEFKRNRWPGPGTWDLPDQDLPGIRDIPLVPEGTVADVAGKNSLAQRPRVCPRHHSFGINFFSWDWRASRQPPTLDNRIPYSQMMGYSSYQWLTMIKFRA